MFKYVNVCYVSMLVVVTMGVKKTFAIAALKVRMFVCLSVRNEFNHFAMSVYNECICSNRLMLVMHPCLLL